VNFIFDKFFRNALEITDQLKVFLNGKIFEENIELLTETHSLSDRINFFLKAAAKNESVATSCTEHPCQNINRSGLSCPVMAQEAEQLILLHF
jgi:DNA polymerase III gamma/tau subunit